MFSNKRDYLIVSLSLCSSDSSHLDNTRAWDNELELVQMLDREMPVMILRSGWEIRLYLFRHWVKYGVVIHQAMLALGIGWRHCKRNHELSDRSNLFKCSYVCENLNLYRVYAYVLTPLCEPSPFEKIEFIEEGNLKKIVRRITII